MAFASPAAGDATYISSLTKFKCVSGRGITSKKGIFRVERFVPISPPGSFWRLLPTLGTL